MPGFRRARARDLEIGWGKDSLLWVASQALQQTALKDSLWHIEPQQAHGGRADLRKGFNARALEPEMFRPVVVAGIKEPDNLSRARLDGSDVTPLVPIANHAGICEVVESRGTPVLATDDVVNLVRKASVVLVDKTIFTPFAGTLRDFCAQFLVDITRHGRRFGGPAPWPFSRCAPVP